MTAVVKTINSRPNASQTIVFTTSEGNLSINPADYTHSGDYSVTFTISLPVTTSNFPQDVTLTWTMTPCQPDSVYTGPTSISYMIMASQSDTSAFWGTDSNSCGYTMTTELSCLPTTNCVNYIANAASQEI